LHPEDGAWIGLPGKQSAHEEENRARDARQS